jgi:hypothetical protein
VIPKPGLTPVLFETSSNITGWASTVPVSLSNYTNRQVRLVIRFVNNGTDVGTSAALDLISINGTTYSFESGTDGFETSRSTRALYDGVAWFEPESVSTSPATLRWSRVPSTFQSTPTGGGTQSLHTPALVTNGIVWLRSPIITLGENATFSYFFIKPLTDTTLTTYLEVIE